MVVVLESRVQEIAVIDMELWVEVRMVQMDLYRHIQPLHEVGLLLWCRDPLFPLVHGCRSEHRRIAMV